jgi:hypothetical protein
MTAKYRIEFSDEQRRAFAELGRKGGLKRAKNLTKKRRREIAAEASKAAAKKRTAKAKQKRAQHGS